LDHTHDVADPQSYGMPVVQYESVYLGLLRSYKLPGEQTIDIQLTISHDNLSWNRVANMATFLPLGPSGSWDDGMIFTVPPIVRGDTIEIFYGGWDGAHNSSSRCARIGVARLRKDGFVSLDADQTTGIVTTKKLNRTCGDLFVNVNAAGGSLKVEVLDVENNVLPGYSCDDCDPITTDSVNSLVTWNSDSQLPETAEPIRLRFVMENASLYSFQAGLYIDPPGSCGDACHPYPQGDLTGPGGVPDCLVNLFDFAKLAQEWMQPPADYDLEDLALLAQVWLEDNQP